MSQEFTPWIERKFDFSFPVAKYPEIIDILAGTPDILEEIMKSVPCKLLTVRFGDKWSLQENAGHLISTEQLFLGRLDDFENNLAVLRAADMSNKHTNEANFNERNLEGIISEFRKIRTTFVKRLRSYPASMFGRISFHPRLNVPMRLVDSIYFQAEHDEHHLNSMKRLIDKLSN